MNERESKHLAKCQIDIDKLRWVGDSRHVVSARISKEKKEVAESVRARKCISALAKWEVTYRVLRTSRYWRPASLVSEHPCSPNLEDDIEEVQTTISSIGLAFNLVRTNCT